MVFQITDKDRALMKRLYGLTDKEVFEAEKVYYRSGVSILRAAKIILNRRVRAES